jgi:hypothetical protein
MGKKCRSFLRAFKCDLQANEQASFSNNGQTAGGKK